MEMARAELIAKSISRETLVHCFTHRMPATNAIGYMDILNGRRDEIVTAACEAYMDYYAPFNFFREIAVKKGRDK